jgi:hypothetical protein
LPALAIEPDPIYAAIEQHRAAYAAFRAATTDDDLNETGDEAYYAAVDLLDTRPTTMRGLER